MNFEPQKEHQWLNKLVGEWTCEGECSMGPDKPAEKSTGTESVRSIGGAWIVAEGQGTMPGGGPATSIITLGYDPQKKRYVGTFIASMMPSLWIYDGELEASGMVLNLDSEGPDMADPSKVGKYRDTIEFKSDDHRLLTGHILGEDGKWQAFTTTSYRRVK